MKKKKNSGSERLSSKNLPKMVLSSKSNLTGIDLFKVKNKTLE